MSSTIIHTYSIVLLGLHICFFLLRVLRVQSIPSYVIIPCVLAVMAIPIGELPILYYFRSLFGNLSLLSTFYFTLIVAVYALRDRTENGAVTTFLDVSAASQITLVIMGFLLYITALGFGSSDLYALGYGSNWMWALFGVLLFVTYYFAARVIFWTWLAAAVLFMFDVFESDNLWDYLMDPVIWFIALIGLVKRGLAVVNMGASSDIQRKMGS